ncbi:Protein hir1 [Nosema granulosis]|uniref:Protein HIR n=1 Tax=Nosema granulosis TaxID=83296 RepID=A0A9P6GYU1_9MICR|nr:Protein hir1 [Nosema granulosis]
MKVCKIKTTEKSKKIKSIFSLDLFDKDLVSSSIAGDITLYNSMGEVLKTFKKHSCSALCVRFFPDGQNICVSYDDGVVVVYNREGDTLYSHKSHSGDVSGLAFTDNYLVSVGYDGFVVFYQIDGSKIVKKIKSHNEKITGVVYSRRNKLMVTQGSDGVVLYSGMDVVKRIPPSEGIILENFFSRMDWSVDGKLLACGLMFNNKANSVEIFDKDLMPKYSLIGHVAPVEVVAFNPNIYFQEKPYHIVALASQDLSISMWNTLKPFPFLLLKNVADMPILDMKWNEQGNVLYFCSYDGLINKLEFEEGELGDVSRRNEPNEEGELFLTEDNIKLHTIKKSKDLDKKLMTIKMGKKSKKIETIDKPGVDEIEDFVSKLPENVQQEANKNQKNINKKAATENKTPIPQELPPADKRKRKRVAPILLDDKNTFGTEKMFIFNYNKKSYSINNTEPFVKHYGDYKIELNKERTVVDIERNNIHFFSVAGEIKVLCCSRKYLCVFAGHLRIYDVRTGNLLFPFIGTCGVCFIDIYRNNILFLETDGKLTIIDVKKEKTSNTTLPASGEVLSVSFSKEYYVVVRFKDSQYFLDKASGLWYLKKNNWNTIHTQDTNFNNTIDETINKLENDFLVYKQTKRYDRMREVVKKFVRKISRINSVQEAVENKLRRMLVDLNSLGQSRFVNKILQKLNKKFNLQYFISDLLKTL